MLRRIVGNRFQVLFHSPPGVLFIFPSRYLSAIGHQVVFRLSGWSRQIHSEFHGLAATWDNTQGDHTFSSTGISPSTSGFSKPIRLTRGFLTPHQDGSPSPVVPRPPTCNACRLSHTLGLASSAFARHYSRNHGCFLFLWVLRCFTSPRSLHTPYIFRRG